MYNRRYNNRRQNNSRRNRAQFIHPSLFVNKAIQDDTVIQQPIKNQFSDFLICDEIKRNIQEKGYTTPTPIQDQIIPLILQGRDVVGIANTGTGKTGAFLIPLLNKIFYNRSERALIIAPTRELALQIQDECKILAKNMNIFTVLTIGGASMYNQISGLKRNPNIIIGTPGRLKDLVMQGKLNLTNINNVVLDEVDRMMDMGFINDIKFLLTKVPALRQSLFFSATIPEQCKSLMHTFLKNPITVSVKVQETAQAVEQDIIKVNGQNKVDVLYSLLSKEDFKKVLVFGRTKWGVNKLARILEQKGITVGAIHGNKTQGQRQKALDQFKKGFIKVLLATDVASRGLDIDDVSHVINYDQPASYDDYIHRIGRTGRANKRGIALTFVD